MFRPLSGFLRRIAVLIAVAANPALAQVEGRFDIFEFVVEGNTVLSAEAIEQAVYPLLGPQRTADDVNAAAAALEKAYQDAGYLTVAVGIPEQSTSSGAIVLQVTEGKVDRLRVTGAEYTLPSALREAAPALAEGAVPHFTEVQEELARLGGADLQVTPLLQPGRVPGSVNVELRVDDKSPWHGSVELNNKRSADTETGRLEASLRYDNLWQRRHSIGLAYFSSPRNRDEVEVFGLNYAAPLGKGILAAFYARSNSNIPTQFDIASLGRGETYGVRYVLPLPDRNMGVYHSISVGLDYKDNEQDTVLLGSSPFTLSQPVKYWVMSAQYGLNIPVAAATKLRFGTTLSAGSTAMNEKVIECNGLRLEQFACRRGGATPAFLVARFEVEGSYGFAGGWLASARTDIQRSSDPLINSEQFSAGGADSVRGYLESERLGDEGERVRLELATPGRPLFGDAFIASGLLFYDWAGLRIRQAVTGQDPRSSLESVGLGLRVTSPRGIRVHADWALALRDGASGNGRTREGDQRLLLKVAYDF